ncbi:putative Transcriptional regulatory protein DegU [Gammaproteobacteria bacterium]
MNIRTLLVDDQKMFREALRAMLDKEPEIEVVGEISDEAGIEESVTRLRPDVVVMDVSMPTINGIVATRTLHAKFPRIQVVALSTFSEKQFVMGMLDAGAIGYVVKSSAGIELVRAITSAMQGKSYLCQDSTAVLVQTTLNISNPHNEKQQLGRRETEVLRLLAEGKSSPQIARNLSIATSTVDGHRRNIMHKLELHTIAELTKYAIRIGLVSM